MAAPELPGDPFGLALTEELELGAPAATRRRVRPDRSLTWWLPGHGEPGPDCGRWVFLGHDAIGTVHYRKTLRVCGRFSCPVCALEGGGWRDREALAIADRVRAGCELARRRPIHVVVSPPQDRQGELEGALAIDGLVAYGRLRDRVYAVSRASGFRGGCAIFHHRRLGARRWNDRYLGCRKGPHFHLIGDGWISPVRCDLCDLVRADGVVRACVDETLEWIETNRETGAGHWRHPPRCAKCGTSRRAVREILDRNRPGSPANPLRLKGEDPDAGARRHVLVAGHSAFCGWVVKNLGVRRSVVATAKYVLSHASQGILPTPEPAALEPPRVVTWFGSMAYSTLRVPPLVPGPIVCQVCEEPVPAADWFPVVWEGSGPPPDDEAGVCEPGRWSAVTLELEDFRGKRGARFVRCRREIGGNGLAEPRPIGRAELTRAEELRAAGYTSSAQTPSRTGDTGPG